MLRGTRARDRLIHALVTDTFDSDLALQRQALALNISLAPSYVAAVCRLVEGKVEAERGGELLMEAAGRLDTPARALFHAPDPHTLAILWPAESASAVEDAHGIARDLRGIIETMRGTAKLRLRAALGGYHPGLHGISRSYLEAQQAMDIGRRLRPAGDIHHYEDVVPHLVLAQNPLLVDRFVRHHLGRLLADDERGRSATLETLEMYIRTASIKETAEALGLHRHTVIYRLDKARDQLDADLDDPAARVNIQLALELRALL